MFQFLPRWLRRSVCDPVAETLHVLDPVVIFHRDDVHGLLEAVEAEFPKYGFFTILHIVCYRAGEAGPLEGPAKDLAEAIAAIQWHAP